jgi:hypothetical protein
MPCSIRRIIARGQLTPCLHCLPALAPPSGTPIRHVAADADSTEGRFNRKNGIELR